MSHIHKKGLTLVELLLAVIVMSMIVLTAANVEVASRKMYFSADRQGQLQLRLSIAMEHTVRNISLVHGELNNPGIDVSLPNSIVFRRDQLNAGVFTPQDYSDDIWMRYWQDLANNLRFCPAWNIVPPAGCSSGETVIANNITALQFIPHFTATQSYLEIIITGTDPVDPQATATLRTYVFPRSDSRS